MALAAAAIKAHFKGGAGDVGPGAASEKAQRIFRESRAQAGLDDLEQPATTSQRPAASRQSLDRQLSGVDAVLMMQKAAPAAEGGTEPSAKMGMKEKQALLNAMFTARNSVVRAPEADEGSDLGDEDDNDDDSLSDVSERSEARQAEGEPRSLRLKSCKPPWRCRRRRRRRTRASQASRISAFWPS